MTDESTLREQVTAIINDASSETLCSDRQIVGWVDAILALVREENVRVLEGLRLPEYQLYGSHQINAKIDQAIKIISDAA